VKGPYWEGDWNCGYGDEGADVGAIRNGIRYLRGLNGNPTNGAGPGNCGRVSCSYDSAIWWCNDVSDSVWFLILVPPFALNSGMARRDWNSMLFMTRPY
jgi:hypothetical protein